jgi:flagellar basal body rod protein FlgG
LTVQDIQTPDGKVDIVAGSHLIAESITATGQIYLQNTTGNIEVGRIQTPSEITIQANDGKILEHGEDTDADIITSAWTKLQASSGIGGDQHLELDENCLVDASITGKGDIAIKSTGSFNILSLKTTDGKMDILAESAIISDVILGGGDVIMQTPDGDIQVNQIQSSSNIRLITEKGSIKDTSEKNTVALTGEGVMTLIASR